MVAKGVVFSGVGYSPDGTMMACIMGTRIPGAAVPRRNVVLTTPGRGAPKLLDVNPDFSGGDLRFTPDGSAVAYAVRDATGDNIWGLGRRHRFHWLDYRQHGAGVHISPGGLYEVDGEGLHHIGIKHYRYRPTPDGADKDKDYGEYPNWAHTIGADRVTSVTFGIALGARQEAHCYGNLFWWG